MNKKIIALLLSFVFAVSLPSMGFAVTFTDIDGHWAESYINDMAERGIISGYGDGTFLPNANVQRCEYAKMLTGVANLPISSGSSTPFADVNVNEWYYPYIRAVQPYLNGYTEDGTMYFHPEDSASREDVTVALMKALGDDLSAYYYMDNLLVDKFSDYESVSVHNRPYVAAAVDMGYITGNTDGTFRGKDPITRAEISIILSRAFPPSVEAVASSDNNTDDNSAVNAKLTAFFLDVGQGDSAFIELDGGKTMLIDAGTEDSGDKIINFIKKRGHSHLDYVIATHPHADHIGGMAEVLSAFTVGTLYMPEASSDTKAYRLMMDTAAEKQIPVINAAAHQTAFDSSLQSGVFLSPGPQYFKDLNNQSAVLKLTYKNTSYLFCGDAEASSEIQMLTFGSMLDSDVLKVGHHGSDSSSSESFIAAVTPTYSVISCGQNNRYNHPAEQTLLRLAAAGSRIFRTDLQGDITIKSSGRTFETATER